MKEKKKRYFRFSKKIVVFCIIFVMLYTIAQTYLSYKLGIELSPTLSTCVYAFFGTELAVSAAIKIFEKEAKDAGLEEKKEEVSENQENLEGSI